MSGRSYVLDLAHNPEPLSPAQQALVEWVDEGRGDQILWRGYLYYDPAPRPVAPHVPADLRAWYRDAVWTPHSARLRQAQELEGTLLAYRDVYRAYTAEVAPVLAAARAALDQVLRQALGASLAERSELLAGVTSLTSTRLEALWALYPEGLGAFVERFGAYAPAWDVAVPCDGEQPERLMALAEALRLGAPPRGQREQAEAAAAAAAAALQGRMPAGFPALWAQAREATALAEDDDLLFFEAQRRVREVLLRRGERLAKAGVLERREDVFWLPGFVVPEDARAVVQAQQVLQAQQRQLRPPQRIEAGEPRWAEAAPSLRGVAVPGARLGPIRAPALVLQTLGELPSPERLCGVVLVLPALLPSWVPHLALVAALVTDAGGALSHGALLARELGIPAVIGTGDATTRIRCGTLVTVDAEAGQVLL